MKTVHIKIEEKALLFSSDIIQKVVILKIKPRKAGTQARNDKKQTNWQPY